MQRKGGSGECSCKGKTEQGEARAGEGSAGRAWGQSPQAVASGAGRVDLDPVDPHGPQHGRGALHPGAIPPQLEEGPCRL